MFIQPNTVFENILFKYQRDFCDDYTSHHCLITVMEKWCERLFKAGSFAVLWTDLSKAFYSLSDKF